MDLGLCIEMIFTADPLPLRMKRAAALGMRNVEMWFIDGSWKGTPEELARVAAESGVRVTNTVIGAPDGSIGGGLTDPARRHQWLERARLTLDFNVRAGIPATIVCTGNTPEGVRDNAIRTSVVDGLAATVALAEKAGITLLLEPLNDRWDHPGYWLTSSEKAAALCREVGSSRLRLLFDVYHMQIMEGDLVRHIEKSADVIGHFHSAGVPGRHELDGGEIAFPRLLAGIEKTAYAGLFAMEYAPAEDEEESLRRMIAYLGTRR
jgi:hydroxypyruvate isomerase